MNPFLDEVQIEENPNNQLHEDLADLIHWKSIYETNEEDWSIINQSVPIHICPTSTNTNK